MTLLSLSILSRGLKPLKTVWLDCVDCCEINLVRKVCTLERGRAKPDHEGSSMTNAFAILQEAVISADDILAAEPEVMVVVDAQ